MFDWNIMKCEEVAEKSGGREDTQWREGYTVSPTEGYTTHTTEGNTTHTVFDGNNKRKFSSQVSAAWLRHKATNVKIG